MTQTGGLVTLYAWLIFAGLLAVLAYLLLRHEQDPCKTSPARATTRTRQNPERHRGLDGEPPGTSSAAAHLTGRPA